MYSKKYITEIGIKKIMQKKIVWKQNKCIDKVKILSLFKVNLVNVEGRFYISKEEYKVDMGSGP